jgi:hypothetical protein
MYLHARKLTSNAFDSAAFSARLASLHVYIAAIRSSHNAMNWSCWSTVMSSGGLGISPFDRPFSTLFISPDVGTFLRFMVVVSLMDMAISPKIDVILNFCVVVVKLRDRRKEV